MGRLRIAAAAILLAAALSAKPADANAECGEQSSIPMRTVALAGGGLVLGAVARRVRKHSRQGRVGRFAGGRSNL
jgi:hypothetical protein